METEQDDIKKSYKRRPGTAGIGGQLYETKLISLILFRLMRNNNIEDFHIASNMDDIGAFDDVCIKLKLKGLDKTLLVLIQAKHKDTDNAALTLSDDDLVKWSDSIIRIKEKLSSVKCTDFLFDSGFNDTEYLFVVYTNGKYNFGKSVSNAKFESEYAANLNELLATAKLTGARPLYTDKDIDDFGEKILNEDLKILTEHFVKYLSPKQSMNIMNDEYLKRYHVVLAKYVVDVSEIKSEEQKSDMKWREIDFKNDFFGTNDKCLSLLKKYLYEQILATQVKPKKKDLEEQISAFLSAPTAATLSLLIGPCVIDQNGKLEFIIKRPLGDVELLQQVQVTPSVINEAKAIIAKKMSTSLKVPISFGNIDIAIRGNQEKIDNRLAFLVDKTIDLCKTSIDVETFKLITIDETIPEGLLSSNGGLGGGVGNFLTYDDKTKFLKFSENSDLLQSNAQSYLFKLKDRIDNLDEYRFDVKTVKFPKLTFDCSGTARDFLSKMVIYAQQKNHSDVEIKLKDEIEEHESTTTQNLPVRSDTMFLYYHNEIQKWWMSSNGTYLTKTKDVYQQAINNIIIEPHICALQNMFYIKIKNIPFNFNENVINSLDFRDVASMLILSNITTLTATKVIQCLKHYDSQPFTVLDLECMINLPLKHFDALKSELKKTDKVLIIICDGVTNNRTLNKRLEELVVVIDGNKIIVIANNNLADIAKEYFPKITNIIDEKLQSLTDLTPQLQEDLIKNAQAIFQGEEVSLETLINKKSIASIKGDVLHTMIRNEPFIVGGSLSDEKYEEIKHLYVDRSVTQAPEGFTTTPRHFARTFNDINGDVVLVTAEPGMGKSTLLTHLSVTTKKCDKNLWIVRINLLDYSEQFYKWQKNKTAINTKETLKFICQVLLNNIKKHNKNNLLINIKENDNKVYLEGCTGNEWATFELNIFLHSYNENKVVFLFDGFDEICLHYKDTVIEILNTVKQFPQQNKMWVTSRPYKNILQDLAKVLGEPYKIEYIEDTEQDDYIKKIWQANLIISKLDEEQVKNLLSFTDFISEKVQASGFPDTMHYTFRKMYCFFWYYVNSYFPRSDVTNDDSLLTVYLTDTGKNYQDKYVQQRVDKLTGTPLLLYLVAEYFMNVIDVEEGNVWELKMNILNIYEMFIESKIRKILFEDKNKMNIYKPDVMKRYETGRLECLTMHKKIAAHTILRNKIFYDDCPIEEFDVIQPFKGGLDELKTITNSIKNGSEKTGFISHLTPDNIPVFVHRTFAEYFASEYISDIFKDYNIKVDIKNLLFAAVHTYGTMDIYPWILEKRDEDKDLDAVLEFMEDRKPAILSWHRELFSRGDWSVEHLLRLLSSTARDYTRNWFKKYDDDFAMILNALDQNERQMHIRKFQTFVYGTMKQHLKVHFPSTITLRGHFQMIIWRDAIIEPMTNTVMKGRVKVFHQ